MVTAVPFWCKYEWIFFPDGLSGCDTLLRHEALALVLPEILDLHLRRPLGQVKALNHPRRRKWRIPVRILPPLTWRRPKYETLILHDLLCAFLAYGPFGMSCKEGCVKF